MNTLQGVIYMQTNKYNADKLVYYEWYDRQDVAIRREKQLKNWKREWKDKLVNGFNPEWKDMAEEIGCDAEYIQAVKDAYDSGALIPGLSRNLRLLSLSKGAKGTFVVQPNARQAGIRMRVE